MNKPLLLIYDDNISASRRYTKRLQNVREINDNYTIDSLNDEQLKENIEELKKRVISCREGKAKDEDWISKIDEASVFIIDFNLIEAKGISINGEEIAYMTRCFSKCDYIIGLNKYGVQTFDLTLRGHLDSYADLNIGSKDLTNLGLWTGELNGYRPWYWPAVIYYQNSFGKRVLDVKKNISEPIHSTLGIPTDVFLSLPQYAGEHLGMSHEKMPDITFDDFFKESDIILQQKDKSSRFSVEQKARIIAARLSKWLERDVIPGQDILTDAPHLVSRYPSLLKGSPTKLSSWNATANLISTSYFGAEFLKIKKIMFEKTYWLSRPAWFWGEVSEDQDIKEVKEPWKGKDYGFIFAEDESQFFKTNKCREFMSDVDSPFRRRFIMMNYNPDVYRPKIRLYEG